MKIGKERDNGKERERLWPRVWEEEALSGTEAGQHRGKSCVGFIELVWFRLQTGGCRTK